MENKQVIDITPSNLLRNNVPPQLVEAKPKQIADVKKQQDELAEWRIKKIEWLKQTPTIPESQKKGIFDVIVKAGENQIGTIDVELRKCYDGYIAEKTRQKQQASILGQLGSMLNLW